MLVVCGLKFIKIHKYWEILEKGSKIEDEHDKDDTPLIGERSEGSFEADSRVPLEEFEERVGQILTDEERAEDIDTLGGLVFFLAGRVPVRGEVIRHESGVEFEILDADPRRVKRLRVGPRKERPAPRAREPRRRDAPPEPGAAPSNDNLNTPPSGDSAGTP